MSAEKSGAARGQALEAAAYERLVQSITDYAIFMLDADGRVASWNSGAQRIKGYAAEEIIGQPFSRFYTPEDRAGGVPKERWSRRRRRAASPPRAGACARTAARSGPPWSSIRCATTRGG